MIPGTPMAVVRGKRPAGGWWLYVGVLLVAAGIVRLIGGQEPADSPLAALMCLAVGASLCVQPIRLMAQTVSFFPASLVFQRFPHVVEIPYATIVRVDTVTRTTPIETFDEVRLALSDGTAYVVSHIADGNDVVRFLRTYGGFRG